MWPCPNKTLFIKSDDGWIWPTGCSLLAPERIFPTSQKSRLFPSCPSRLPTPSSMLPSYPHTTPKSHHGTVLSIAMCSLYLFFSFIEMGLYRMDCLMSGPTQHSV